jgi:hypothetical protein
VYKGGDIVVTLGKLVQGKEWFQTNLLFGNHQQAPAKRQA